MSVLIFRVFNVIFDCQVRHPVVCSVITRMYIILQSSTNFIM